MTDFSLKVGDTSPAILVELTPDDVDVSGASVVFNMWDRKTKTVKIDRSAATIVAASGPAKLSYAWAVGDTDTEGIFEAEFEVTYVDGSVETFPNNSYIRINVKSDIA